MFTMFKEPVSGEADIKKWPWSMRRFLALGCFLAFVLFGTLAIERASAGEWMLFIPCGLALVVALLLLYFTTLADLKETALKIAALLGKGDGSKT